MTHIPEGWNGDVESAVARNEFPIELWTEQGGQHACWESLRNELEAIARAEGFEPVDAEWGFTVTRTVEFLRYDRQMEGLRSCAQEQATVVSLRLQSWFKRERP